MRKILVPILALLLASAVLLVVYNLTLDLRCENQKKELQTKMETILPGSTSFQEEAYTGEDAYIAFVYKGETGYVIGTSTAGYAGPIQMLIGVHNDGSVTGLPVLASHTLAV